MPIAQPADAMSKTQNEVSHKVVIFVDIPDPDNLHMIFTILTHHRNTKQPGKLAIVLSPRALDLRVPRYESAFKELLLAFDPKEALAKLSRPLRTPEKVDEIHQELRAKRLEDLQEWFYIDDDCRIDTKSGRPNSVKEDTELYVELAILRYQHTLQRHGFERGTYDIYWDPKSITMHDGREHLGDPAMRHAFHVDDYKYYFSKNEMQEYKGIVEEYNKVVPNEDRRQKLRSLLGKSRDRLRAELDCPGMNGLVSDFENLVPKKGASLIIGGPFTEAVRYLERLLRLATPNEPLLEQILVMAGSWDRNKNIFPNQFNIHADPPAARDLFNFAKAHRIGTKIVPTDCIKNEVFEIPAKEAAAMLKQSRYYSWLVGQFITDTGSKPSWYNFDGIAAAVYTWSEEDKGRNEVNTPRGKMFDWLDVDVKALSDDAIVFEKVGPGEKTGLKMAMLNPRTGGYRDELMKTLSSAVPEDKGDHEGEPWHSDPSLDAMG